MAYVPLGVGEFADQEVRLSFRPYGATWFSESGQMGGGAWLRWHDFGFGPAFNGGYIVHVERLGSDPPSLKLSYSEETAADIGATLDSQTLTGWTLDNTTIVWIKARAIGDLIEGVAWLDGDPEPEYGDAGVSVSATDSDHPFGFAGVYGMADDVSDDADNGPEFLSWEVSSPTIPPAPFARYRAAGLTPGAIASWPDEGSGGNDLAQATGANQPTAEAAGFNGNDSVLFDSTEFMQTGDYAATLAQPNTIVLMGEVLSRDLVSAQYYFDAGAADSSARNALIWRGDQSAGNEVMAMFAGSVINATGATNPVVDEDVCIVAIFNGASSELRYNNGADEMTGNPGAQGLASFSLAARFSGMGAEVGMHMRVVEVLIYDRALDSTELAALQDYFEVTYLPVSADVTHGIVLGHQVAGTVEEATVTVDVTHGIVLGQQVEASSRVTADPTHGIVLGHAVEGSLGGTADVTHGIVLGHQVEGTVEVPVDAQVAHGIVLGHQVEFTVEVTITTRPIQPMADLRPIQPSFTAG